MSSFVRFLRHKWAQGQVLRKVMLGIMTGGALALSAPAQAQLQLAAANQSVFDLSIEEMRCG